MLGLQWIPLDAWSLKVFMVKLSQFNLSKIEWVKKDYYSRKNGSKLTKKAPPDGLYIVL